MKTIPSQWVAMNKLLNTTRWINILLFILFLISLIMLIFLANRPPVVIVEKEDGRNFYQGNYIKTKIKKEDIEIFIKDFVKTYYSFDKYDIQSTIRRISPLSTVGFKNTLLSKSVKKIKQLKGKKFSQRVLDIEIVYENNRIIAIFEKLLRIEGVPFIVKTQAVFKVQKGVSTKWNPMGVYIDGIIEHEKSH